MTWPTPEQWRALETAFRDGRIGQFSNRDVAWQENAARPDTPEELAIDAAYVILNSGMAFRVTSGLWPKIRDAIMAGKPADQIPFGHVGKRQAMRSIWCRRVDLFAELQSVPDAALPSWCERLPWIGPTTCYHLAKNWGAQVAKPDVWLVRAALRTGETPQQFCERIAALSGLKVPTVDLIVWAALSQRWLTPDEIGAAA